MNPFEFGQFVGAVTKQAADPRAMVATPESGSSGKDTAMVGGAVTNVQPEYEYQPDAKSRKAVANTRENAFNSQAIRAYYNAKGNAQQGKEMGMLSRAAPAIGSVAGQLTGQPALGFAGGVSGALLGALGEQATQQNQPALDDQFQTQKALFESVTPPIRRAGGGKNYGSTSDSYPWNKK